MVPHLQKKSTACRGGWQDVHSSVGQSRVGPEDARAV